MDWIEKMEKLLNGRSYAVIERAAGWPDNTLSNAVRGEQMPGADKAIRLARALGVPAEWLFDDDQGCPPPTRPAGELLDAQQLAQDPAMREALVRLLREAVDRLGE